MDWSLLKRCWAEFLLASSGLLAVVVIAVLGFPPTLWVEARCVATPDEQILERQAQVIAAQARIAAATRGVAAIPDILNDIPREGPFHFETILVLHRLGKPAIPALIFGLSHSDPQVRLVALRTLASLAPFPKDSSLRMIPKLIHLLRDPSNEVRFAAVLLLGRVQVGKAEAVPALIQTISETGGELSEDPVYVRQGAIYLLGRLGAKAKSAVPELTRVLADPESNLQHEAAVALWRITGDVEKILPYLNAMLLSPDSGVRDQAETALKRIHREPVCGEAELPDGS